MAKKPSEKQSKKDHAQVMVVNGGWVARDAKTGRFVEVGTNSGIYKSTTSSSMSAKMASSLRSAALKRLADR